MPNNIPATAPVVKDDVRHFETKSFRYDGITLAAAAPYAHVLVAETKVRQAHKVNRIGIDGTWTQKPFDRIKRVRYIRVPLRNLVDFRRIYARLLTKGFNNTLIAAGDSATTDATSAWGNKNSDPSKGPVTTTRDVPNRLFLFDVDKLTLAAYLGGKYTAETFPYTDRATIIRLTREVLPEGFGRCEFVVAATASYGYVGNHEGEIVHKGPRLRIAVLTDTPLTLAQHKLIAKKANDADPNREFDLSLYSVGQWIYTHIQFEKAYVDKRGKVYDYRACPDPFDDVRLIHTYATDGAPSDAVVTDDMLAAPASGGSITTDEHGNTRASFAGNRSHLSKDFRENIAALNVRSNLHDALYSIPLDAFRNDPGLSPHAIATAIRGRLAELHAEALGSGDTKNAERLSERLGDVDRDVTSAHEAAIGEFFHLSSITPPAMTADQAAAVVKAELDRFVALAVGRAVLRERIFMDPTPARLDRWRNLPRAPLVITASPGTGKTKAIVAALRDAPLRVCIMVASHKLAAELLAEFQRQGVNDAMIYKGFSRACKIWCEGGDDVMKAFLGAKGSTEQACAVCPHKGDPECEFDRQDLSEARIVIIAGPRTLMAPVPKKAHRAGRRKKLRAEGNAFTAVSEDDDTVMDDPTQWEAPDDVAGAVTMVRRGDFDLVIVDETSLAAWTRERQDESEDRSERQSKLTPEDLDMIAGLTVPPDITGDERERMEDAIGRITRAAAGIKEALAEATAEAIGVPLDLSSIDPRDIDLRFYPNAWRKPTDGERRAVVGQRSAKGLKEKAKHNRRVDLMVDFVKALRTGWTRIRLSGDDPVIEFGGRDGVHWHWANTPTAFADATLSLPILRQFYPLASDPIDARAFDGVEVKRFFMRGGPTNESLSRSIRNGRFIGVQYPDGTVEPVTADDKRSGLYGPSFAWFFEYRRSFPATGAFVMNDRERRLATISPRAGCEADQAFAPLVVKSGYFGNIKGTNEFTEAGVDELMLFGRHYPPADATIDTACSLFNVKREDLKEGQIELKPWPILVRRTDGRITKGVGRKYTHPDWRVQAVIDATIGAELVQADGRLRAARRGWDSGEAIIWHATIAHAEGVVYDEGDFDLGAFDPETMVGAIVALYAAGERFTSRRGIMDRLNAKLGWNFALEDFSHDLRDGIFEGRTLAGWVDENLIAPA